MEITLEFLQGWAGLYFQNQVIWHLYLGTLAFRPGSFGLETYTIWHSELNHQVFILQPFNFGIQNQVIWHLAMRDISYLELGHLAFRPGIFGIQSWVIWHLDLDCLTIQTYIPFGIQTYAIWHLELDHCHLDLGHLAFRLRLGQGLNTNLSKSKSTT